jgi:Ion channel
MAYLLLNKNHSRFKIRSSLYKKKDKHNLTLINDYQKYTMNSVTIKSWDIIQPDSLFIKTWNVILINLLLYTTIVMPYRMAFIQGVAYDAWWWLDTILNIMFFFDFLITCFLAYTDEIGNVISDHKKIFFRYLKGWMFIDIIGFLPFDYIFSASTPKSYNNLVRLFKLPRLYRLLKISKLFKILKDQKQSKFLIKIQDYLNIRQSFARLLKVFAIVLVTMHVFACLWAFFPQLESDQPRTWTFKLSASGFDLYILSLYWCLVTFSAVGYGDILPGTTIEFFIAICWMIFGVLFYSFMIGTLASILTGIETK